MSFTFICLLAVAAPPDSELKRFEATQPHMGTTFGIVLYAADDQTAEACFEAAFARVARLNAIMSDYDPDSELSRLSAASPTKMPIRLSLELFTVLQHAQRLSEESDGAFDVTVGPLSRLWRRARRRKRMPSADRLSTARNAVGYRSLRLDTAQKTVELLQGGMRLDLGGIAKGFAADEALAVIRAKGVTRVLINAGGDVVLGEAPPKENGWKIGVAALERGRPPSRFVRLANCAVATSGDAWQYVEIGGKRYSHILDPRTGLGLTTRSSVTVIAPTGMEADSLASAVSVLGPEKGIALLDRTKGTSGLTITKAADGVRTHQSRGFPDPE